MIVSTGNALNARNLTLDTTALDLVGASAETDTMAPISATEKWEENLGRIKEEKAAEAAARVAAEARQRAARKALVANGKAVRKVCRELDDSEDCCVIREYIAMRNTCDRTAGKHEYEPVVVPLCDVIDRATSIYQNSLQMVVTEGGIRILHRGFSWDTAKRPTWFQRRATELFDAKAIAAGMKAAADAIRYGEDPKGTSHARIGIVR